MVNILSFWKKYAGTILAFIALVALVGIVEYFFGRTPLGPDGRFGWWDNDIWGSENSQRVADVYTLSHIAHGLIFYFLFFVALRKVPLRYRFIIAVILEVGWEILENSPIIINRYREATIAQGYEGDSIMNSMCDVVAMAIGYWYAYKFPAWASVVLLIVMEVGALLWVRDNLTLNVLMLVYPSDAIMQWQSAGHVVAPVVSP